jgi:exodeoxyribonuclease VII large subunit
VGIDCRAARADVAALARRLHGQGRRAIVERARTLTHLSRAPAHQVARHRRQLHQLLRELRASARRACEQGRSLTATRLLTLERTSARAQGADAAKRRGELESLALALAAHDPDRTLARGYALVQDRAGVPLGSAADAISAGDVRLRFADGTVDASVDASADGPADVRTEAAA